MPNPIKYSTSGQSQALKIGNTWLGTGDVAKGPTEVTNYWSSIDPPTGGYTVNLGSGDFPATFCPANDAELISLTNRIAGASYTTAAQCLAYYAAQSDKNCLNITYPPIVTSGLILSLDAGFTPSYPKAGTTWYDLGGNGYNSNLVNGPAYSTSGAGSVAFDGVDDSSSITCNFTNLNGLTVNIFYYSNVNSNTALTRESNNAYIVHFRGAGFYLIDSAGTVSDYLGWNPLPTGLNWRMLTATWDGSTMRLYQNGVKQTGERSFTGTGILRTFTSIALGYNFNLSQPSTNGNISNYQLYNRALSNSEIIQNYQAMFPRFLGENIVTSGLSMYLDAGYSTSYSGSGTAWYNVSGNGGSATLINGPTYSSTNGGTIVFDGVNDYANTGYTITSSAFSVTIVYKCNNFSAWAGLWACEVWDNKTGFLAYFSDVNTLIFGRGGSPLSSISATTANGTLAYYTFTLNQNNLASIYINGVLASSGTLNNVLSAQKPILLSTRYSNNGSSVTDLRASDISIFSVYDRALTAGEITQNFNAQKGRFGL